MSSSAGGGRGSGRSEFIKTTIKVLGGDPAIGAAITDFYTPRFRETFVKWLQSIEKFVRPYEFTLGKVSSLLEVSPDSLFRDGDSSEGCFGPNVKTDNATKKKYFDRNVKKLDEYNNTVNEIVRNYCPYGTSKKEFVKDLAQKRLALERAESIYMTEGATSTSSFDIEGGSPGCELDSIEYLGKNDDIMKTWPSWDEAMKEDFKVIFEMQEDLPEIEKDAEFAVKYFRGRWYTAAPGQKFKAYNSCPATVFENRHSLCIAEVPFVYIEQSGILKLDVTTYKKFGVKVPLWLQEPLGHLEALGKNMKYDVGKVGHVPCNVKWSNNHQLDTGSSSTCLYFKAASEGSIHIVFAGLPQNSDTWYSIRISSGSISFYQAMKLTKVSFFGGFIVCFSYSFSESVLV